MANVIFKQGTRAQYDALAVKDSLTLYWLEDTQELYKGDKLYGRGIIPEYEIVRQETAEAGMLATYRMKVTTGTVSNYVGDSINIPADKMLSGGELRVVETQGIPYHGAEVGDPYLDLVLNDESLNHIYVPVKGMIDPISAGDGITIVGNVVSIKLDATNANGLSIGAAGLGLSLASRTKAGAMSAKDKLFLDSVPSAFVGLRYAVRDGIFNDTLVSYENDEVKVMFPATTVWQDQQSGEGSRADRYYFGVRFYAPAGAVKLIDWSKSDKSDAAEKNMTVDSEFVHQDEFGRWYRVMWLPAAKKLEDGSWSYFGAGSTAGQYIGWTENLEWYDANGKLISADAVRISLTNEDCHTSPLPSYMKDFAKASDLANVQANLEWGNI